MSRQVMENVSRLPKWAQRKIEVLEMRVSELKTELDQIGSKEPTDTRLLQHSRETVNLPNHSIVEFRPKDGPPVEVCLRHDDTQGIIVTSGHGGLRVQPWASNVVKIYVEGY